DRERCRDQSRAGNMAGPQRHLDERQPIDKLGKDLAAPIERAGAQQHHREASYWQGIVGQQIRNGADRAGKEQRRQKLRVSVLAVPEGEEYRGKNGVPIRSGSTSTRFWTGMPFCTKSSHTCGPKSAAVTAAIRRAVALATRKTRQRPEAA